MSFTHGARAGIYQIMNILPVDTTLWPASTNRPWLLMGRWFLIAKRLLLIPDRITAGQSLSKSFAGNHIGCELVSTQHPYP